LKTQSPEFKLQPYQKEKKKKLRHREVMGAEAKPRFESQSFDSSA
jgi:hypothetical protein